MEDETKADIKAGVASIQQKLDDLAAASPPTIYPFPFSTDPTELRHYTPEVLSIGPYHQHKEHRKSLDEDKKMFLRDLLSRARGKSLEDCFVAIMELESRARSCYKDTDRFKKLSRPKFVEVLVMDGCFIIELLYRFHYQSRESTLSLAWSWRSIWIDLLKLENQIPFFVLEVLFNLLVFPSITASSSRSGVESKAELRRLAVDYLKNNKAESWNILHREVGSIPEVHTLLHLYYLCLTPGTQEERQSYTRPSGWVVQHLVPADRLILFLRILADILMAMIFSPHRLLWYILMKALAPFRRQQLSLPRLQPPITIPCATQLDEDGVKFKMTKWTSLYDITFSRCRGIMQIPQLSIDSETLALIANLIIHEQRQRERQEKYMISYAFLMDCLINSPKDVAVLRESEIIVSDQDDNKLANFFNKVCRRCDVTKNEYYYAALSDDVKEYRQFKLLRWRAYFIKLKRDYFGNPWALISFLAAVTLLCLTIAQTFFTIYPYYHP